MDVGLNLIENLRFEQKLGELQARKQKRLTQAAMSLG